MARLIDPAKQYPGTKMYEEWIVGTSTEEVILLSKTDDGRKIKVQMSDGTRHTVRLNGAWRYWNTKPTDDERELTEW